jgi:hypothetical protein
MEMTTEMLATKESDRTEEHLLRELSEFQLALVGGGIGEVILG